MKKFLKNHRFLPAPMEGIMRPAVISVCNELDLTDIWITPFFRVSERVPRERELSAFLRPFASSNKRVVLQIMGTDAERLSETALRGMAAGAAGIDLNCGCPSRQVIAHGAGAGCLRDTVHTAKIIKAVRKALGKSFFSVKTRLGFDDWHECLEFLPCWEEAGTPDMFTLHYRTAREGYRPVPCREERLQSAVSSIKNALIFANGDVTTAAEAADLSAATRSYGVMIGRGFWRDPFILKRAGASDPSLLPDPAEARQILLQALLALPYEKDWALGSAIELASLIAGADSPEAVQLKRSHCNSRRRVQNP